MTSRRAPCRRAARVMSSRRAGSSTSACPPSSNRAPGVSMVLYLLRRMVYAIPIALAVGFVCFMLVQIAPGDPINAIVPPDAPADVVEQVRKDYGLDKPLPVQFGLWLT